MKFENIVFNSPYWLREIFINLYGYKLSKIRFNEEFNNFYEFLILNLEKDVRSIQQIKLEELRNILQIASRTKYYNQLFKEHDFKPDQFDSLASLHKLPLLTKEIIRNNFSDLLVPDLNKNEYITHYTSGTTGPKMQFYIPKALFGYKNIAFHYRLYYKLGLSPFDRRVTIGGRKFTNKPPFYSVNYFENQLLISSHHLDSTTLPTLLDKIKKFKPEFIQGHPNSILKIAVFLLDNPLKYDFDVKGIFTTGETLIEYNRNIIESAFKCKVLQQYGSGESVISASEDISQEFYSEDSEKGHIELMPCSNGLHEIIGTSLINTVMPFIRYKMNDFAVPYEGEQSNKGLPKVFKDVIGRIDDIIKVGENSEILPVTIRMIVKDYLSDMEQFQFIQLSRNSFELRLTIARNLNKESELKNALKRVIGKDADIRFIYNSSILTNGGKIRNVISKV